VAVTEVTAQDRGDLRKVERQIARERKEQKTLARQRRTLKREAASLRKALIDGARRAQEKEAILTRLEKQLADLVDDAKAREAALAAQRRRLAGTLGALARLSRNAPQALIVYPGRPIDMVRSAMLLRVAVPQLKARTATLAGEIDTLARVKRDIAGKLLTLRDAGTALDEERGRLRALLKRKDTLRRRTEAAWRKNTRRLRDLAARARTLRDLIAGLRKEARRKKIARAVSPPPAATPAIPGRAGPATAPARPDSGAVPARLRPFPARGPITLPVAGRLVGRYGEATDFGDTARGIRLETRRGAQVVTPYDGKVVFAGPFRGYGQILIIEHRGGYHTLLAGMARIDAVVGQWVLAGEPLGVMGTRNNEKPTLYVELRRNGQPVNPLPWMAVANRKVRG